MLTLSVVQGARLTDVNAARALQAHMGTAGSDLMNKPFFPFRRDDAAPPGAQDAGADRGLRELLGAGQSRRSRTLKVIAAGGVVLLLASVGVIGVWALRPAPGPQYTTEPVRRGDLQVSVSATGSLEPVNQVDVGSELSGAIEQVLVDDNDRVVKGQVLATLDTSRLRDQIANGEAALEAARANVQQAQATATEMALKAGRLHRLYDVSAGGYPARTDVDAADAALERSRAGVASARAGVNQALAALNTNRTNLAKAVIRSPVSGVVLARKVEPGQTVAASLQAPVLFTLAEDMRRMELHADIDEADVSQVREGRPATFTVDAYPGRNYAAAVRRVGLGSKTTQGVVTYTAVLDVDNRDLTLRPGMTASAEIASLWRPGVLLAPVAALQFRPPALGARDGPTLANALTPRMPRFGGAPRRRAADAHVQEVWILRNGQAEALPVRVGASNGQETEISGAGVSPGLRVIVGSTSAAP